MKPTALDSGSRPAAARAEAPAHGSGAPRAPSLLSRSRLLRIALCATTGIAFGLAAPPRSAAWLVWLALLPTLYVLRNAAISRLEAALLGSVSGLGIGLVGFAWIGETLVNFGGFPWPLAALGLLLYAVWMAVPYGLFGLAVAWGPRSGWLSWLWSCVCFVTATHSWPLVFPYTPLIGITAEPAWLQVAELGGVPSIEILAVTVAWLAVRAVESSSVRARAGLAAVAALVPLLSLAGGGLRMARIAAELEQAPSVRVGIVQPNTPPLFGDPEASMERLWDASARAAEQGAEWIVWPEAGPYPYPLARPLTREPAQPEARVLARHRLPTLFGAITYERDDPLPYNTLVHLDAEGRVRGSFEKVELVPFGEHIPFVDPRWLLERIPTISHINAGSGPARFTLELGSGTTLLAGPLICYEDIIPDFAWRVAVQEGGIEVFVNATIDAWYGASSEPWEHLALAQIRSVEHRIPMVRSVSTGVSSVISATGEVAAFLPARPSAPGGAPPHEAEILVHDLAIARDTATRPTWYARAGFLSAPLCQAGVVVLAVVLLVRARRQRRARVT